MFKFFSRANLGASPGPSGLKSYLSAPTTCNLECDYLKTDNTYGICRVGSTDKHTGKIKREIPFLNLIF